jgi:hypothetical protein
VLHKETRTFVGPSNLSVVLGDGTVASSGSAIVDYFRALFSSEFGGLYSIILAMSHFPLCRNLADVPGVLIAEPFKRDEVRIACMSDRPRGMNPRFASAMLSTPPSVPNPRFVSSGGGAAGGMAVGTPPGQSRRRRSCRFRRNALARQYPEESVGVDSKRYRQTGPAVRARGRLCRRLLTQGPQGATGQADRWPPAFSHLVVEDVDLADDDAILRRRGWCVAWAPGA